MDVKTPAEVINAAVETGRRKVALSNGAFARFILLSVLAGAYIAFGGTLSLIVGYGFPGLTADNPSLQRLLSGCMFPIGLILVVVLGAELFTGNNALLVPAWMRGHYGWRDVLRNWTLVYLGNFVGALLFVYLFVYSCGRNRPHRRGQGLHAVAHGAPQGHRGKLVCLPRHMARHVGPQPA